jgi:hypothetical protein
MNLPGEGRKASFSWFARKRSVIFFIVMVTGCDDSEIFGATQG